MIRKSIRRWGDNRMNNQWLGKFQILKYYSSNETLHDNFILNMLNSHCTQSPLLLEVINIITEKKESEIAQSCPTLCNPMYCNLPSSSVHGIFQARLQEWGAIAFSRDKSYLVAMCNSFYILLNLFANICWRFFI